MEFRVAVPYATMCCAMPIELLPYLDRIGEVVLRLIDALRGGPPIGR